MKIKQFIILALFLGGYTSLISQQLNTGKTLEQTAGHGKVTNSSSDVLTSNYIQTYPNPTSGPLSIVMNKVYSKIIVEIRSISGKLIAKEQYENTSEVHTTLTNVPEGLYLVKITGDDDHQLMYRITKR